MDMQLACTGRHNLLAVANQFLNGDGQSRMIVHGMTAIKASLYDHANPYENVELTSKLLPDREPDEKKSVKRPVQESVCLT
jgi:hypothetical protein